MTILVTGGAGYIGSHTCVALLNAGYNVVIVDNFDNSHPEVIKRIEKITGRTVINEPGDIRDREFLESVLTRHKCTAVIHFAGLKAVGESAEKPLLYYDCNVSGTLRLLQAMQRAGVKKIIFSSTATVYGTPAYLPYDEKHPLAPESVYGRTKLTVENMLRDLYTSQPDWSVVILRYFNPVGAHESGLIGEDPKGIPNNLMPIVAQVAAGRRDHLMIWGNDYKTRDGTGVRDYIHVEDLANGHVSALKLTDKPNCEVVNLGCGKGYSVLEVIKEFQHISNREIKYEIGPRRAGDIGEFYANPETAKHKLNWQANRDLRKMCADMWNFQVKNPEGYQ
ncbi:UDP-glucose 4-epimerase GalE [Bartonella sp. HY329]|uniref:UDP-glucose 4-epimerase GalE n=1 Tax=unclassified Bartonella TaxID=2645622 RepID=UPI0021C90CB8|nr:MULTISPECIES: UDP-glucose 4-epimerase GalE [unclassified Bartonella]UXM96193.1 UDP-glucose 4-epimerase GalE [Bartonella sp. HY329]UXN10517.1 UDP-glucose 4-epimerase GalE [Bartonella sp. HY328]